MQSFLDQRPYLAFRLLGVEEKRFHFPKIHVNIKEETEVLFVAGVIRAFDCLIPFLERGGRVVFVEESVEKVAAFLALREFIPHSNLDIVLDDYTSILKKTVFKKHQFIGQLDSLKRTLDEFHMSLSEYQDLGKTILRNVQGNLLHTKSLIHGKSLEKKFLGMPVIICGSGPTLTREKLLEFEKVGWIFAAGSSIPKLIEWEIRIDAGFFIDPWPPIDLYKRIGEVEFPLFYQNRMSEELFRMHRGPKVWMGSAKGWAIEEWLYEQIDLKPFFFDGGWNAGSFALHVAHFLGCSPITRIGIDGGERRDLARGVQWMEEFLESHPNGVKSQKHTLTLGDAQTIDREKLRKAILELNRTRRGFDAFLQNVSKREQIIMEADLVLDPVYEQLIEPLWQLLKELYGEGKTEVESVIAKALFAKRVLQFQQTFRFYPSGALYAKETKDGISELFYETGEVKARVGFSKGVLEGEFSLYGREGEVFREGKYVQGKKEGVHRIYDRLTAEFVEDVPVRSYIRKNEKGVVIEELFYHNREQFDQRRYSETGKLKSEGIFVGDHYIEKRYHNGEVVQTREGVWKEGKLAWL